jgi:biopolymer transport protein ExbD
VAGDLPASNAQPQPSPDKPVFLTLKPVGNEDVPRSTLQARLDQRTITSNACSSAPTGRWPTTRW